MPIKPQKAVNLSELNTPDILNVARNEIGGDYAQMVPQAISPGDTLPNGRVATMQDSIMSLRGIGNVLENYEVLQNSFLNSLVNRIAMVIIQSRLYENPLSFFKKGVLTYGETIEEIFVNLAKPYQFKGPAVEEQNPFKVFMPDVRTRFHSMNYRKVYPITVTNDELRQAFLSWSGITDLIGRIIDAIYTGVNYDEFMVMKYLIAKVALRGGIYPVKIDPITATNARTITTQMVQYGLNFQFMGTKYNEAGVPTYTDPRYLYTILTSDISALFDVEVLALSFNMSKAEIMGRRVLIDGFGTFDTARLADIFADDPYTQYVPFTDAELTTLKSIQGLMVDESFFMIFDNFQDMKEIYNPRQLYWNYYYHVWKTFSTSAFANAVLFTTATSTITAVTVTPSTATMTKGSNQKLTAAVTGTNFVSQNVSWSIVGTVTDSSVDANGVVTVGADETATTFSVKATSQQDNTKSGSATITVSTT